MNQFIECQIFINYSVQPEGTADAQHLQGKQQNRFFLVIGKFSYTQEKVRHSALSSFLVNYACVFVTKLHLSKFNIRSQTLLLLIWKFWPVLPASTSRGATLKDLKLSKNCSDSLQEHERLFYSPIHVDEISLCLLH